MSYSEYTLTEAIEAVRMKMVSDAYPARQAAIDAAIAEVDLTVAEFFLSRAEATRERVYGFLMPRMPEIGPPEETQPVALSEAPVAHLNGGIYGHADPAPHTNGHYADPYVDEPYENPRFMNGGTPHEVGRHGE